MSHSVQEEYNEYGRGNRGLLAHPRMDGSNWDVLASWSEEYHRWVTLPSWFWCMSNPITSGRHMSTIEKLVAYDIV